MRLAVAAALALLVLPAVAAQRPFPNADAPRVEDFVVLSPLTGGSVATTLDGNVVQYWWSNGTARHLKSAPAELVAIDPSGEWALASWTTGWVLFPLLHDNGTRVAPQPTAIATSDAGFAMTFARDDRIWLHPWDAPAAGRLRSFAVNFTEDARTSRGTRVGEAADQPEFNGSFARGMAMTDDGRLVAVADGTRLLVVNTTTQRVELLPAPELDDEELLGLAFSPDGRHLAAVTRPAGRFGEARVYDLARGGAVVGLHRAAERPVAVAWGAPGLAVTYADTSREIRTGVARVFEDPTDLSRHALARRDDVAFTTGLAWSGDRLFVGLRAGILVMDARLQEAFTSHPGYPPLYPERAPEDGEARVVTTDPPPSTPAPEEAPSRRVPGAAAWLGALIAALISSRRPRRA